MTGFPHFDAQTVASQGNAILGIRDSGKSYTAIKIAELLYEAGIPFVAFDPIGRWRFLRVPGHGHGYPVVVAGGIAGDIPLNAENAVKIVRAAMQAGVSLVVDLYEMEISKADWRKIVGDAVRVLLYENGSHGLRHIFIEEAAEFAPQRVGPDQGRVYAEVEKLARMGGNARLGYTLINQRAEEVNKAVLELCDNLFLHRQKGRNSLNALTKWLDVADVQPGSREIIKSLPTLPQGECWAWMAGTDRPMRLKVPTKNSFEPDRRAMHGTVVAGHKPVDVAEFVADLRARLAGKPPVKIAAAPKKVVEDKVTREEADELRRTNEAQCARIKVLEAEVARLNAGGIRIEGAHEKTSADQPLDLDFIFAELKSRARNDSELVKLLVRTDKPEIDVVIQRKVVELDGSTPRGRFAALIAQGFFDKGGTNTGVRNEMKRTGADMSPPTISKFFDEFTRDGFLIREGTEYRSVPGMKVNIREAA